MKPENTKSTVLIVDDNPMNLNVLINTLSHGGLNVSVAQSGEETLNQVAGVDPDIILLDVIMPGIDGFEVCRRLKDNEMRRDIPVIFMTALSETINKVKGFDADGVDYITKPFATYDGNTVKVTVSDTGIGIPEEKLPNLFRINVKTQRAGTAGEKGTGLGLILCKEFVEKNGGTIWVESKVGQGSRFMFTLPCMMIPPEKEVSVRKNCPV